MFKEYEEKLHDPLKGGVALTLLIVATVISVAMIVLGFVFGIDPILETVNGMIALAIAGFVVLPIVAVMFRGLCTIDPNEAIVLVFFGRYLYTVSQDGFYFVNPLANRRSISLKARTLTNDKQKVNDERGNPIEIGVVVIWRVVDTAAASFKVEGYYDYLTTQADSAIRNVARSYPYDVVEGEEEMSLRGSSKEISLQLASELQERVGIAGIEILEARISNLAYAPEIAAAMLQRQQAEAVVQARQKIVDGAVGMVEMALTKLSENNIVELDTERKAQMVSNLLVVLCGNKDAQPIVNSGTIY